MAPERRISRIIATASALSGLLAHARLLQELQLLVTSILPAPLRNHVRVANVHNGTLILNADSPVWATELRFRSNEILNSLIRKEPPCQLVGLGLRTRPPESPEIEPLPPRPELSEKGASALAGIAEGIDTPELREALLRLASRAHR